MKISVKYAVTGALSGAANGFFGAGGGLFLVPLLISWCGMEQKRAFATSVAVIFPLCAVSAVIYWLKGGLPIAQAVPYLLGGAGGGVLFIPAHLVADVVEGAAKTHVKDDFGFEMICQGKFTTAQIDKNTWTEEMLDMLLDWIKNDPRGEEYRDLDWSKEYDLARNGDPNDTQTAL